MAHFGNQLSQGLPFQLQPSPQHFLSWSVPSAEVRIYCYRLLIPLSITWDSMIILAFYFSFWLCLYLEVTAVFQVLPHSLLILYFNKPKFIGQDCANPTLHFNCAHICVILLVIIYEELCWLDVELPGAASAWKEETQSKTTQVEARMAAGKCNYGSWQTRAGCLQTAEIMHGATVKFLQVRAMHKRHSCRARFSSWL